MALWCLLAGVSSRAGGGGFAGERRGVAVVRRTETRQPRNVPHVRLLADVAQRHAGRLEVDLVSGGWAYTYYY